MSKKDEEITIILTPETREIVSSYLERKRKLHADLMKKRGKTA